MRSTRTLLAVAALLVLATAVVATAATAIRHPGHARPTARRVNPRDCRIGIDVVPHTLTSGDPVIVFGRLTCEGADGPAGQSVKLYGHLSGPGRAFTLVQATTTDAGGFYEFDAGTVSLGGVWYVRCEGVRSVTRGVKVAAVVTLSGPPDGSQLLTGPANKVTFAGTVDPSDAGSAVVLQRQDAITGGTWHRIDATATVGSGGSFSIVHTFERAGSANIRVVVSNRGHVNPHNAPSPSNVLGYEISQAQNPRLTIQASANPIVYGQSVTIEGVLAGGAGRKVTLLAGRAGQKPAAVATVGVDGSGGYRFTGQAPSSSTVYRVKGGGRTSAALFVGVRDVLVASVSATSVQAGQPLTFSGTVAPDHSGHVIYLERQNAHHPGFHVVQVASVGPGSSFAIAHTTYDAGTAVFRVQIPGGPENEGAVSAPFTIAVTPAPAEALAVEVPGNSSLPVGGQL